MRGEAGARLVDQAWRTAGVRELLTIPLYLTALLSLPENEPFPTTKEQILRHFVEVQETEVRRAEVLRAVAQGLQKDYLDRLAVLALRKRPIRPSPTTALAVRSPKRRLCWSRTGRSPLSPSRTRCLMCSSATMC